MSNEAPTDALRLVPSRDDGLTVGRAILEAHSQWEKEHGVTGLQNPWQEQHIILLGQAAILAAPASPLPEGGGDDPHERWSILNHLGGIWTDENFGTEREANAYLDRWKRENPKMDLSRHKVIPVLVTITAAPTGAK